MKNIKSNLINVDYFLIFLLLIYLSLILTFYYKPPWIIDHLTYVITALPQRLEDLKFWNSVSSNLPEGTLSERWSILIPIIIFNKIFFFLPPHLSSQIFIITNWVLILIFTYILVKKIYSETNAKIFLIIFVLGIHHTKNRATEILADPVGVLLVVLLFLINILIKNDKKFYWIGSLFLLIPMTKIHYGIFLIFFSIQYFKKIIYHLPKILIGILFTILFCELIFFLNYEKEIFFKINQNTLDTLIYYFTDGGSRWKEMKGDQYWSSVWLGMILNNIFLPPIFLVLIIKYFYNINKNFLLENLTIIFLILILSFSYLVSFPNNDSYAYPIYIFSIIFFSKLILEIKPDNISDNQYVFIVFLTFILIFPASYLYEYHVIRTPKHKLFLGEFIFVFSIVYIPLVLSKFESYHRFILIWPIIFVSFFSHNYYNIKNHYWWRNGYNAQYEYFNTTTNLIKERNTNYLVVYETWPLYNRPDREKFYPKLALQNMTRKNITVDFEFLISDIETVKDYLITDNLINDNIQKQLGLNFIEKKVFFSSRYEKDLTLFLFRKK